MESPVGQENTPNLEESTSTRKFAYTITENSDEPFIKNLQAENKLLKAKDRVKSKQIADLKTKLSILEAQKTVTQSELEDLKAQTATQSDLEDLRSMVSDLASAIKVKPTASIKRKNKFLKDSEAKKYKPLTDYYTVVKGVTVKSEKEAKVKQEKDDGNDVDVVSVGSSSDEENASSSKKAGTKKTSVRAIPQPVKRRTYSYGEKEVVIKRIQEVLDADQENDAADLITDLAENEFEDLDLKTLKSWWADREKILREIKRDPSLRTRTRLRR